MFHKFVWFCDNFYCMYNALSGRSSDGATFAFIFSRDIMGRAKNLVTSTSAAAQRATLLFLFELIRRIHHFSAATLK